MARRRCTRPCRPTRSALVKALLARGADPNARLTKAPPPLRGDFVDYKGYVGATPFWLAANARYPNVDILRALAAAGAEPRVVVQDGTTPLMAAVGMAQNDARLADETSALEVVKVLVELGADMNAVNRGGQTALHGATRSGRNSIVQFLAEHGAGVGRQRQTGPNRSRCRAESDPSARTDRRAAPHARRHRIVRRALTGVNVSWAGRTIRHQMLGPPFAHEETIADTVAIPGRQSRKKLCLHPRWSSRYVVQGVSRVLSRPLAERERRQPEPEAGVPSRGACANSCIRRKLPLTPPANRPHD